MNVGRWRNDGGQFARSPDADSTMMVETQRPVMGQMGVDVNDSLGGYSELQRIAEITDMIENAMQNMNDGRIRIGYI